MYWRKQRIEGNSNVCQFKVRKFAWLPRRVREANKLHKDRVEAVHIAGSFKILGRRWGNSGCDLVIWKFAIVAQAEGKNRLRNFNSKGG